MTKSGSDQFHDVQGRRVGPGADVQDDFTYSVVSSRPLLSPSTREQRKDARVRTRLREGVLLERAGRVIADCRIRDRSRSGARLQLDKDRPLPRTFLLSDTASRTRFWATLVWQAGRDAGVRLTPAD